MSSSEIINKNLMNVMNNYGKNLQNLPIGTKILAGEKGWKENTKNRLYVVSNDGYLTAIDNGERFTRVPGEYEFTIVDIAITTKEVKLPSVLIGD